MEDVDGIIQSIYVENFFCHKRLNVELNKNANFIVGRNGSGKSAILTALVVGLGGRATTTNRGNSINLFIRKDNEEENRTAVVKIKIKNSSPRAYKHDQYGDSITIIRKIKSNGSSSYEIKSATGDVISTKLEEIREITTAHDIQVDNPISVLNQDDARSFDEKEDKAGKLKYKFFRRATNLNLIENYYNLTQDQCQLAKINLGKKQAASAELEREYKKWKSIFKQFQSRDEIEAHKQLLQNEYYWSEIVDLERDANNLQQKYDEQMDRVNRLVEELERMQRSYGGNSDALDALKQKLDDMKLQTTNLEQEIRDMDAELRSKQDSRRRVDNEEIKCKDQLTRENNKKAQVEEELQNIESGSAASELQQLEARAAAARAAAAAAAARRGSAAALADHARLHADRAAAAARAAAAHAADHHANLRKLKQQLVELDSRGDNSLAVFGRDMITLCDRIKASQRLFSKPPKGPIGAYIKVKDKKWAGVLEHIIGGSIRSFCVNTPEDSRKLFEIMNQVFGAGRKPAVTCSRFLPRRHDTSRGAARAPGLLSALDALQLPDHDVANYLIDNLGLETILLVPTHEEATKLADNERNVPKNCARLITPDCTEYYPAPNYRYYGGLNNPPQPRILQCSTQDRKRQLLVEIEEIQSQLRDAESQAQTAAAAAQEAGLAAADAARTAHALIADDHRTAAELKEAESALEYHHEPRCDMLKEELNNSKEKLSTLSEQLKSITNRKNTLQQSINELKTRIDEARNKLQILNKESRAVGEEYEKEKLKRDSGASDCSAYKQRITSDQAKLAKFQDVLKQKRQDIDKKIKSAEKHCCRIDEPRERALLESELQKAQLKLTSYRSVGLSREEVTENLAASKHKYDQNMRYQKKVSALIENIESTTQKHRELCFNMQKYIVLLVQENFKAYLGILGQSGDIMIDIEKETLKIRCTGRENSAKRQASSTRSLSGGERSYSTVAFMMALWECVELPFYFMDEFDVYMDPRTRSTVMELLIDYAKKNSNRQFVFLTPQDSPMLLSDPDLSIHMTAAELKEAESALEYHHEPRCDMLKEELNNSKEKLSTLSEQLKSITNRKNTLQQSINELKTRIDEARNKLQILNKESRAVGEEYEKEKLKRDSGASDCSAYKQRITSDQAKLAKFQDVLKQKRQDIDKKIKSAEKHCCRIDEPRERALLESELQKAQLKLTSYRSVGLSREEVTENLAASKHKYDQNMRYQKKVSALIENIESTTQKHRELCFNMQKYIVLLVQENFKAYLGILGQSGDIMIDIEKETLKIRCTGRENSAKRQASSTRSLSGGERSYSTVAFMMALWECVELPFYFMDEFDVYMDPRTRSTVMELLIDYAKKNSNRQFVFLTPQDSPMLLSDPDLSIHMMPDPIRSNS